MADRRDGDDAVVQRRGVEQLVARRAHNPKVAGSSPASPIVKEIGSKVEQRRALFKRRGRGRGEDGIVGGAM